jgi:hypothetical protein
MQTVLIIVLVFIALEGLVVATLPDMVKTMLGEAPAGLLIAAGLVEAGIAGVLMALLLTGNL